MKLVRLLRDVEILAPNSLIPLSVMEIAATADVPMVHLLRRSRPDSMAPGTGPIDLRSPLACALCSDRVTLRLRVRDLGAPRNTKDILQDADLEARRDADAELGAGLDSSIDTGFALGGRGTVDGAGARVVVLPEGIGDVEEVRPAFVAAGVAVRVFAADVGSGAVGVAGPLAGEVTEDVGWSTLGEGVAAGLGLGRDVDDVAGGGDTVL